MPRYALVNLENLEVRNVATINTVPPAPNGFRNLIENLANPTLSDWLPENEPRVGWFWDGAIPASFSEPPELPETQSDALELARQALLDAMAAVDAAIAKG
jgi:hypothetical protein